MKSIKIFLLLLTAAVAVSCSVVFTGSITGSLVDEQLYNNGNNASGIADAEIYLYTDMDDRDTDYEAWVADESILPDKPIEGEPLYFLKTITDDQGSYTFNGFIWNELFPKYGKSGDRKEIYMLFYHRDYGLTKTAYPVYVVSDVTNRIPLFKLNKIMNTAEITGSVSDAETDEPLANANIYIWVPESWSYSGNSIDTAESSFSWSDTPSYTALTDNTGNWRQNISYKMMPSSSSNQGTTILRVTYAANGYIAENSADSDITDGGWDRDANGSIDSDEDEGYFQSEEITAGSYAELGEIALADEYNTATVSGKVLNTNTNEGEQNVTVRIWVADDWSYTSANPADIAAPDSAGCVWPENPSYTLTTNASGDFNQNIQFERKPSEADNWETTRIRLVFEKNTFLINETTDNVHLTDGGWDRDGSGTIDADEDDAFMDPSSVITAELDNNLGSIKIKQTEFSETLSGEIWDGGSPSALVNGVEVWLFYDPDSVTHETDQPLSGDSPNFTETSASMLVTQSDYEKGHFSFRGLEWTDTSYTGNQSRVSFYIHPATAGERATGVLSSALGAADKYYLIAGSSNYVSLTQ